MRARIVMVAVALAITACASTPQGTTYYVGELVEFVNGVPVYRLRPPLEVVGTRRPVDKAM